jgi:hypothetical protein
MVQILLNFWKLNFQLLIQFACVVLFDLLSVILWAAIYHVIRFIDQFLGVQYLRRSWSS